MSINLTATNQKLKVITSAAVQTQVVTSGRDNARSIQTPVSQDTNIPTATTTDIIGVPDTSTQRLIDDVEISIVGSGTQQVTVQKDVGGTVFQLYTALLNTGDRAHFTNDGGWRTFAFGGQEKGNNVGFSLIKAPALVTSTQTYSPSVNCTAILIELWAQGGQGGGVAISTAGQAIAAAGGSAGGYTRKFLIGVPSSFTITIGASTPAGTNAAGAAGLAATATINGVTYTANGGPGGTVGPATGTGVTETAAPSLSSTSGTNGDESIPGSGGEPGERYSGTQAVAGDGGWSPMGAAGRGRTVGAAGEAATGFNAGGAGALSLNASAAVAGGIGAPGCARIWEFTS